MILRYCCAFLLSFLIVFLMFLGMNYLISINHNELPEDQELIRIKLGVVRDVQETRFQEKMPELISSEPAPATTIEMDYTIGNVSNPINLTISDRTANETSAGFAMSFIADGEYLPIVRVLPQYPARAAERGLEGRVLVIFTVTPNGSTTNVRVLESSDRIFERNAVRAAERFKYKPKVVNGKAVSVDDVRTVITFVLEDKK